MEQATTRIGVMCAGSQDNERHRAPTDRAPSAAMAGTVRTRCPPVSRSRAVATIIAMHATNVAATLTTRVLRAGPTRFRTSTAARNPVAPRAMR